VSARAQTVRVGGEHFAFMAGETIHTENSYKYAIDEFQRLAAQAGCQPEAVWTDAGDLFSVHLLRAVEGGA
jgi:L-histidine Nalpha-methyltransferase